MEILQHIWGATPEGEAIVIYTLKNSLGSEVQLSNIGAGIVSVKFADREGNIADVVLGYKDPLSYFGDGPCAGKTVGRVANRIAGGQMTVEGKEYHLEVNNGPNHLHGGTKNFSNRLWESCVEYNRVIFTLVSEDGDCGYPGEVTAQVVYDFDDDGNLVAVNDNTWLTIDGNAVAYYYESTLEGADGQVKYAMIGILVLQNLFVGWRGGEILCLRTGLHKHVVIEVTLVHTPHIEQAEHNQTSHHGHGLYLSPAVNQQYECSRGHNDEAAHGVRCEHGTAHLAHVGDDAAHHFLWDIACLNVLFHVMQVHGGHILSEEGVGHKPEEERQSAGQRKADGQIVDAGHAAVFSA